MGTLIRDTGTVFWRAMRLSVRNPAWLVIMMMQPILYIVLFGACHPRPRHAPPAARPLVDRVVLISVDGLLPETYMDPDSHGLLVPTLRRLMAALARMISLP